MNCEMIESCVIYCILVLKYKWIVVKWFGNFLKKYVRKKKLN